MPSRVNRKFRNAQIRRRVREYVVFLGVRTLNYVTVNLYIIRHLIARQLITRHVITVTHKIL